MIEMTCHVNRSFDLTEMTCHVNHSFDLIEMTCHVNHSLISGNDVQCNFSGIEALEFSCIYTNERKLTQTYFQSSLTHVLNQFRNK